MRVFEEVEVDGVEAWRAWLDAHHTQRETIWLVTWKAHHPERHLTYEELVCEALCYGWIDSQTRTVDADRRAQMLSPRRPGSGWSAINKARIERLTAEGRLRPAGIAAIEAAKADGSWAIYDDVEARVVPDDLAAALAAIEGATDAWAGFAPTSQKNILWWLKSAKTAPTRQKRIAETARLAGLGLRAQHPEAKGR
ncbi:MAG: YdeI/OmpD-associated family protein [Myxococcales bacterium]|nr:YdeI/OmpD-associated family protein [Myxococcales bacterium]